MFKPVSALILLILFSCGDGTKQKKTETSQVKNPLPLKSLTFPGDLYDENDLVRIADVLPTMYYTARESEISCSGNYRRIRYNGKEKVKLLTPEGKVIASVCKRFSKVLLMEGSAILRNRGQGEIAINYGGKVQGTHRYYPLGRCRLGEGIRRDLCLLPYHTIAADNRIHKIDEIIYIPEVRGLQLPDGSFHDGYFIVRDTGGAFQGIGAQRVDLFTGTDPDSSNAFQRAGFHHKRPMEAYKIGGDSAELIREKLREIFGELY